MSSFIQSLIERAQLGDMVRVPGGTYDVDAISAPLTLRPYVSLDLTGVTLQALPAPPGYRGVYPVISVSGCKGVLIINGMVRGDRLTNSDDAVWERGDVMGHGILIREGSSVRIVGTVVRDCMGDGIIVWSNTADGAVELERVVCEHNRRQALSIVGASNIHVHDSQFSNSGGTPPGDGIDVENDLETETCANILIERCVFYGNTGACIAFGSPGKYINCRVGPDNDFDKTTQPIWAGGNAAPLGTSWWAFLLNRALGWLPSYRWWGYPTEWYHA